MKRLFIIVIAVIMHSKAFSQQVSNVKATQVGSKVSITYDLNDQAGKPYYVKLLMSKDGGSTFSDELKFVTGDVKNIKAGLSKKIVWDASQEVSYYDGDAVFRVEAVLKSAPLPEPIDLKCSKVELVSVKGVAGRVTIDFLVTSLFDCSSRLVKEKGYASLFDTSGNEYGPSNGKLGDTPIDYEKNMIKGIPVRSQYIYDNIPTDLTSIPLLKIRIPSGSGCDTYNDNDKSFQFRNVPISR